MSYLGASPYSMWETAAALKKGEIEREQAIAQTAAMREGWEAAQAKAQFDVEQFSAAAAASQAAREKALMTKWAMYAGAAAAVLFLTKSYWKKWL